MMYKSEEEFLKAYNPDDYERLSMTTDILILFCIYFRARKCIYKRDGNKNLLSL